MSYVQVSSWDAPITECIFGDLDTYTENSLEYQNDIQIVLRNVDSVKFSVNNLETADGFFILLNKKLNYVSMHSKIKWLNFGD